jgi:serine/threonine protein kinase
VCPSWILSFAQQDVPVLHEGELVPLTPDGKRSPDGSLVEIDSGAFSSVYRVQWAGQHYAYKRPDSPWRLTQELQAIRGLRHENVMGCRGLVQTGSRHRRQSIGYLMDLMDEDLHKFITRGVCAGPTDAGDALRIAYHVALGLKHLHERRVVHRDLHTGNVFIQRLGPTGALHVMIADFNCSRPLAAGGRGNHSRTAGAVAVIPPECRRRYPGQPQPQRYDTSYDMYGFGLLLAQLVRAARGGGLHAYEELEADSDYKARLVTEACGVAREEWGLGCIADLIASAAGDDPARRPSAPEAAGVLERAIRRQQGPQVAGGMRPAAAADPWQPFRVHVRTVPVDERRVGRKVRRQDATGDETRGPVCGW